jgi:NRPS condensation-like uncharacterized protein
MATMKRKLFYPERLLLLDGNRLPAPMSLTITPVIKGNIPEERVKNALAKMQQKHPALRARIENEYICFEEAIYPPIPLRIVERVSENTWKSEKEKYALEPWDCKKGPMLRVLWVRSEEISEFVITGLHAVMDGRSLYVLVRDFYVFLNQPDKEVEPYQPVMSMEALFPDIKLTRKQKLAGYIWTEILRCKLFFTTWNKKIKPVHRKALLLQLDEETSALLKRVCKENNVAPGSVSAILFAKLFKKYFQPKASKCDFKMTLDLRRYSPAIKRDMIFSHGTTPFSYRFHPKDHQNVWKQAYLFEQKLADTAITKQKTDRHSLRHSFARQLVFIDRFYNRIFKLVIKKKLTTAPALNFMLYNLGQINFSLKNPEFQSYRTHTPETGLPYFASTAYFAIIDNFNTTLDYYLYFNGACTPEEKMTTLFVEFEQCIKELAKR